MTPGYIVPPQVMAGLLPVAGTQMGVGNFTTPTGNFVVQSSTGCIPTSTLGGDLQPPSVTRMTLSQAVTRAQAPTTAAGIPVQ